MNKKDFRWLLAAVPALILIVIIVVLLMNTAGRRQDPTVKPSGNTPAATVTQVVNTPGTTVSSAAPVPADFGALQLVSAEHPPTLNETWWVIPYIDYTIPANATYMADASDSLPAGSDGPEGESTSLDPSASLEDTQVPDASADATQDSSASPSGSSAQADAGTSGSAGTATTAGGSASRPASQSSAAPSGTTAAPSSQTTAAPSSQTTAAPSSQTTAAQSVQTTAATEPAGTKAPETWGAWSDPAWSWGNWVVVKAATATAEGTEERTGTRTLERFSNYGRKETKTESKKETRTVPKLEEGWSAWKDASRTYGDWQWGAWTVVNPATCNGKGTEERTGIRTVTITQTRTSNTGKTQSRELEPEAEIKTESRDIAQLSHKYTSQVVAATSTAQGYTLHTCSLCKHSYKDNFTTLTETWGEWVWGAWSEPEWNWGEWTLSKAATYDDYGVEERVGTRIAERQGTRTSSAGNKETDTQSKTEKRTEYRYTPKLDEGWGAWVEGAWDDPAWNWGEWKLTQAATYDDYGIEERTGTRTLTRTLTRSSQSGKTETKTESKPQKKTERRNTPKLVDTWGDWKKVEGSDVIPEWTYGEWKVIKEATTTAPGRESRVRYRTVTWTEMRTAASGRTETRQQDKFFSENEYRDIPQLSGTTAAP